MTKVSLCNQSPLGVDVKPLCQPSQLFVLSVGPVLVLPALPLLSSSLTGFLSMGSVKEASH